MALFYHGRVVGEKAGETTLDRPYFDDDAPEARRVDLARLDPRKRRRIGPYPAP
jgi:hypothetical protein